MLGQIRVLFCQLNDDEVAYAKVLLDEVFGRENFLNQVSVKMKQTAGASGGGEDKRLKKNIEYILVYSKNKNYFNKFNDVYDEVDLFEVIEDMKDEGKSWKYTSILKSKGERKKIGVVADGDGNPIEIFKIDSIERTTISKVMKEEGLSESDAYKKYFNGIFSDTNAQTSIRQRVIDFVHQLSDGEMLEVEYIPRTGKDRGQKVVHSYISNTVRRVIWLRDIAEKRDSKIIKKEKAGTFWDGFPLNNLTKEGDVKFPNGKKPEALIKKILELATNPGDYVLDSFGGSGTTGAVAHKMGRRWIMIELGDHCETHIVPRLKKVIDGEDQGGITKAVNWQGGGGFRYLRLAPSLLKKDNWGNWVINKEYNPEMLSAALCKHMGFTYAPSQTQFWNHGYSTENDFIYVTTGSLAYEQLKLISEEVGSNRTLLICCKAFITDGAEFPNLTIKKIPQAILNKCEWDHDDYSFTLNILPDAQDDEFDDELEDAE